MKAFEVADLFAGAGGCTTGALMAADIRGVQLRVTAVNHWPIAVETHTRNHPEAKHFCASIDTVDPRVAVPGGKLDLLIAAPECTHHSSARGGKPINDQSRASAWHILRWVELLQVEDVLIENVPEFQTWGPIGRNNRPLKSRKGETFKAFIAALASYGYQVEFKVLNAADYGAATTRRRLFIRGSKRRGAIAWPATTHSKAGGVTLFGGTRKWGGAREIIDWSLPSQSIFNRKRPLQPATIRRIVEGLKRFGGPELQPFIVQLTHGGRVRDVDNPLPTVTTANRGEIGVAEPFLVPFLGERDDQTPRTRWVDDPLQTITTSNPIGLIEPFILQPAHGSGGGRGDRGRVTSIDAPIGTQPASNRFALIEPFVLGQQSNSAPRTTDQPIPTVAGAGKVALIEPFVLSQGGGGVARPVSEPAPTIVTDGAVSLVEPYIVTMRNHNTPKTLDEPIAPLCTGGHIALAEPFLTKYNRTAKKGYSVDDPLDTVSTRDRFALVQPVHNGMVLDIRFRMLQPHELSAAMSFPKAYVFTGNKGDQIKQIGNAVDCSMAKALCGAIFDARRPAAKSTKEAVA